MASSFVQWARRQPLRNKGACAPQTKYRKGQQTDMRLKFVIKIKLDNSFISVTNVRFDLTISRLCGYLRGA